MNILFFLHKKYLILLGLILFGENLISFGKNDLIWCRTDLRRPKLILDGGNLTPDELRLQKTSLPNKL